MHSTGRAEELSGEGRVQVLTPHPGEMARLTGLSIKAVEADRIGLARRFATEHRLTLVLKGWRTLIAHSDGRDRREHQRQSRAGQGRQRRHPDRHRRGDVLAQYARSGNAQDVARAVEAAVYLHGLAGDFAARDRDEHTVLATDTVAHLSDAYPLSREAMDGHDVGLRNPWSARMSVRERRFKDTFGPSTLDLGASASRRC